MKRICIVVPSFTAKGGIAAVVNGYRGSELENKYNIHYVETYCDGNKLEKIGKALLSYMQFIKVLVRFRPDVMHIHSSFGKSFFRKIPFILLADWKRIPVINHVHGAEFEDFYINASRRKKSLIQMIYQKCRYIVALSDEWEKNLSQIVSTDKIIVIHNYSMLHEEALYREKFEKSGKVVLFLGFINKRKGCFDLPFIVEQVVYEIPDVKFVLAGTGDIQHVQSILREKEVSGFVEFPGWITDTVKDKLLRQADLLILPSYNEGMPMAILDAMGYGLPIVSTKVGGIPKLVGNGQNGYIVTPGDVNGLSHSIIEILKNDELRIKMGLKSIELAKGKYSFVNHCNQLEIIYNHILFEGAQE